MSTHRTVTAINLASSVGVRLDPEEVTPELEAAAADFLLKLQEIWNARVAAMPVADPWAEFRNVVGLEG